MCWTVHVQSAFLDGTIVQELATVPGYDYVLSWYSWFGGADNGGPLIVGRGAASVTIPTGSVFGGHSLRFTAVDSITRLAFSSRRYAVALDEVAVVPAGPRLSVASISATQAQLGWSTNFADYVLERATNLPATAWTTVTNRAAILGDRVSVTVDTSGKQGVFRLRTP